MDQPDQPFLLADLWLIHDVRSAKLDQPFHIVLDQLSRSAQLSPVPRCDYRTFILRIVSLDFTHIFFIYSMLLFTNKVVLL